MGYLSLWLGIVSPEVWASRGSLHVQKKTFTKWVNSHLARVSCRITDLYTDLRDGRMLIKLLEVLSGERLVRGVVGGGCEVILYHRWGNVFEKSSLGLSRADLCG